MITALFGVPDGRRVDYISRGFFYSEMIIELELSTRLIAIEDNNMMKLPDAWRRLCNDPVRCRFLLLCLG